MEFEELVQPFLLGVNMARITADKATGAAVVDFADSHFGDTPIRLEMSYDDCTILCAYMYNMLVVSMDSSHATFDETQLQRATVRGSVSGGVPITLTYAAVPSPSGFTVLLGRFPEALDLVFREAGRLRAGVLSGLVAEVTYNNTSRTIEVQDVGATISEMIGLPESGKVVNVSITYKPKDLSGQ